MLFILAGVPVLNLLNVTPKSNNDWDKSFAANSPLGPPLYDTSPIIIFPFKYVPVASTTALHLKIAPFLVTTPVTLPSSN